jgi:hypothetical protein
MITVTHLSHYNHRALSYIIAFILTNISTTPLSSQRSHQAKPTEHGTTTRHRYIHQPFEKETRPAANNFKRFNPKRKMNALIYFNH